MAANVKPARKSGYFMSCYMPASTRDALRAVSIRTGISQQRLLRDGIAHVLNKHKGVRK